MNKTVKIISRSLLWTLLGLLGLVVSLIVLIYIPPVQDFVIPRVLSAINKPGQLEISARKVRLKFPLRVEIDSASFAVPGMEAGARAGRLNVSPLPLLRGEISVSDLKLDGARFRLGTPDSAFYMTALVNDANMSDARIRLSSQRIMVGELMVDSGKVDMAILPDTVPRPEAADSVPANWHVTLVHGALRRIRYNMSIYPTITELGCHLQQGDIRMADVDMRHNTVDVQEVSMSRADARYIYPTPEWLAAHPAPEIAETDTVATVPWTVRCAKVRLTDSDGLYAMAGHRPLTQNFDLEYIRASQINIAIDSFVNRGTSVYAPIRSITARERCGIPMELTGLFDMDSVSMRATGMRLTTATSSIALNAMMGLTPPPAPGDKAPQGLDPSTPFRVDLRAQISNDDLRRLAPAPIAPIADALPRGVPVNAAVDADGTMGNIRARLIKVEIPRHLSLMASGVLRDITDINRASGHLTLDGSMPDISFIKPTLLDAKTAGQIKFPRMTISGEADINRGDYAATFRGTADDGTIALDGTWKGRGPAYELTFTADRFPVQSIMPSLGISNVSADVDVRGHGLDIFSPSTAINAGIDLRHLGYKGQSYENINARADIAAGNAAVRAISTNRDADFDISATGNLTGDTLRWRLKGNLNHIDLMALQLSDTIGRGSATLSGEAAFTLPKTHISGRGRHRRVTRDPLTLSASLDVERLNWQMPHTTINTTDILANVDIDTASCALTLNNGDLSAKASAGVGLDTLMTRFGAVQALLQRCMARRQLAVDSLQMALPDFRIALNSGDNNVLTELLRGSDLAFDTLALHASNDSLLRADATLTGLQAGKTRADSIALRIRQRDDHLLYQLKMDNRPGTMDQFAHVVAQGYISVDNFLLIFNQRNISDETGFSFGSVVTMPQENTFSLKFVPFHPIIGYKNWQINPDNFLRYNVKTGHIDANINLHNEVSSLLLTTDHVPGDSTQEALRLQLKDIKVQDWLAINPFAPPMRGNVSADMRFNLGEKFSSIDGKGNVSLTDFYYNNQRVADFNAELGLTTSPGGVVRASSALIVDGVKTITVTGALNDSTLADPFNLDFEMIRFPLAVLNPFMPKGTARFHGLLTGSMDVTGNADKPLFNGWIRFDSTAVNVEMMGSTLDFPTTQIPVKDNLVTFDNFAIHAVNDNPLVISGTADISSLADIGLDITARARNTQIVGAKKKRGQDMYGRLFIDLDARVRGSMARYLDIRGSLDVLAGTNVTYVVPDMQAALTQHSNQQMVRFVNFTDSAAVAAADSLERQELAMNIDFTLNVAEGSTLAVDLSADGKNRAQIQAAGQLQYTSDYLGDQRLTGRMALNKGYVRYGMPPVMSEKTFNIEEGSNIVFNGPVMNPTLNLHATDNIKASVSSQNNPRVVTFDVGLNVTGTLEQMNVVFGLSSPDDLEIQNEIESMSPDQRANQAMNLLLYGSYTGPGTKASTMGNPLYNFLEGQLNSLASSAIKGVDISFGIDQLDRNRNGLNSTAMQYSYRVSKSLFDDRFKIVVGGNYTTDADADENFSQNLIADISFEYMINKSGTMYVRLFRHTGYESILEGEITQTGVGFVYRHKFRSFRDIFNWLHRRKDEKITVIKEEKQ